MLLLDDRRDSPEQLELDSYAQFRDQTRFWIQRVAVPLLMMIGLFGNSITVIIMTRRRMRSTTNMYLAALAFVDMLYLVLTFLLGLSHYPNMAGSECLIYWKCRPFLMMLTDACSNTSVWLTVTFTIERFIAVKYPMKGKVWCTEARAKMLIVCVFMFGVLFAAPVPFEWQVVEKRVTKESFSTSVPLSTEATHLATAAPIDLNARAQSELIMDHGGENLEIKNRMKEDYSSPSPSSSSSSATPYKTILALDYSEFGSNETFKTIYYGSTAILFYFIPLFLLMLFNGFLIKSVHQSQRERTKMVRPSVSSTQCCQRKPAENASESNGEPDGNRLSPMDGLYNTGNVRSVFNEAKGLLLAPLGPRNKSLSDQRNCMKLQAHTSSPLPNSQLSPGTKVKNCLSSSHPPSTPAATIINLDKPKNTSTDNSRVSVSETEYRFQIDCDIVQDVNVEARQEHLIAKNDQITSFLESKSSLSSGHQRTSKTDLQDKSPLDQAIASHPVKQTLSLKRSLLTNSSTRSVIHPTSLAPVSSQERRITIMLIAVVILFLVCQIPSAAMLLYTSVRELEPNSKEEALVLAFGNIFNFLMAVNAAGDFILYSFLSKKYRKTFMILFCSCMGSQYNSKQSYQDARRSIRFESSSQQLMKKCSSTLQNSRSSVKSLKNTPL